MRAGISLFGGFTRSVSRVVLPHLKPGDVVGRWNIPTAGGAGLLADAGEQYPQVGEHLRNGAHSRPGAVIGKVLVDADRGGKSFDAFNLRLLLVRYHTDRFQVLAY